MLVLLIGDLHVPDRASGIPEVLRETLSGGKINKILCTGNLCTKQELEVLKTFSDDVQTVHGDFDDETIPDVKQIIEPVGSFKIGIVSASGVVPPNDKERLHAIAREMDVDILGFGGGHVVGGFEMGGKYFVNPGSGTGAFTPSVAHPKPSFVLIRIQASTAQIFAYVVEDDGKCYVKTKDKFTKNED